MAITLTSGFPWYDGSKTSSPPTVGTPTQLPYPPTPRTTPSTRCRVRAIGRVAEAQRVEDGDRARAHGEDVAQDAAHAGRGTLVRLDGARVVVDLDLERDGQPIADRDDARLLARTGDHALARRRQRPQQRLGALVRAMLAPHDAEHRELEVVRIAAQACSRIASSSTSVRPSARWSGTAATGVATGSRSATVIGRPRRPARGRLRRRPRRSRRTTG